MIDATTGAPPLDLLQRELRRGALRTLQINLGRTCNLACSHCHVEAGPKRLEQMSLTVRARIEAWIARHHPPVVDLTGGAPELLPGFRELVRASRASGAEVIDRCNLAVLDEPGQEDLATFLAEQRVTVVASLPCYLSENVDRQRGRGTYDRSIAGLRALNALGYGRGDLRLHLVYNPTGPALPPEQRALEQAYRDRLRNDWDIAFDELWCLANVPITRFRRHLEKHGELERYEALLAAAFNSATLDRLMCRTTLSVDHDGSLYDCDFHLAVALGLGGPTPAPKLWEIDPESLIGRAIPVRSHCLACTAGAGSSCTGAIVPSPTPAACAE